MFRISRCANLRFCALAASMDKDGNNGIFKFAHLRKIRATEKAIPCMSLPYFFVADHTIMMNFIDKFFRDIFL